MRDVSLNRDFRDLDQRSVSEKTFSDGIDVFMEHKDKQPQFCIHATEIAIHFRTDSLVFHHMLCTALRSLVCCLSQIPLPMSLMEKSGSESNSNESSSSSVTTSSKNSNTELFSLFCTISSTCTLLHLVLPTSNKHYSMSRIVVGESHDIHIFSVHQKQLKLRELMWFNHFPFNHHKKV